MEVRGYRRIDGGRAAKVALDDVALDDDALVGDEGTGFATLTLAVGYGLVALASEAVGAMDVAKEHTLDYLRTRKQFGVRIGTFQALQHRMADVLLDRSDPTARRDRHDVGTAAFALCEASRDDRPSARLMKIIISRDISR